MYTFLKRNTYIVALIALLLTPFASHATDVSRSVRDIRVTADRQVDQMLSYTQQASDTSSENTTDDSFDTYDYVDDSQEFVEDELLITFDDWVPADSIADTVAALAGDIVEFDAERNTAVIRINQDRFREMRDDRQDRASREGNNHFLNEAIAFALEGAHVTFAEPNYIAHALGTPNDPYYKYQWNFPLINVDDAWDTTKGDNVTVAIIDTGVAYKNSGWYTKAPDLAQTSFAEGYNAISTNSLPLDDNGHGTHLAGIVAGSTNNNLGVAGIAPSATIMPVKVLDEDGNGTYADIVEGIYWAVDNGADIINLSLGGSAYSSTLEEAVKYAYEHNVVVTVASGNSGGSTLLYPAAYNDYVISVGAVQYDATRADYSNYGTGLTLMAPGGNTDLDQNNDGNPDGILQQTLKRSNGYVYPNKFSYYFYRGTSVASPHVAGVAALVKSVGVTNVDDIKHILTSTTRDLGASGYDTLTGYGLVDAQAAVIAAQEQLTTNNSQPTTNNETQQSEEPVQDEVDQISNESEESGTSEPEQSSQESTEQENTSENTTTESNETSSEEETTESNQANGVLELDVSTYNMFGKKDGMFAFWEKAYVGMNVADTMGNPITDATLKLTLTNMRGGVTQLGTYTSNEDGELWAELGSFSRGAYELTVSAVSEGFAEVVKTISFRFR